MMNVVYKDYGMRIRLHQYVATMDKRIQRGLRDASIVLTRQIVKNLSGRSQSKKTFRAATGERTQRRIRDKETGTFEYRSVRKYATFANTNPYPGVVSGDLRRGVMYNLEHHAARIGVRSEIPYAAIHEFGGTITQHRGGKTIHINIPKRSYIRPAFEMKRGEMLERLRLRLTEGLP